MRKLSKNLLALLLYVVFQIVFLFEDIIWKYLVLAARWLARLPLIRAVDKVFARLTLRQALALFITVPVLIIPAKVYGTVLIAEGHFLRGLACIIAAKLFSTLILARIYAAKGEELAQTRLFLWWHAQKARVMAFLRLQPWWLAARRNVRRVRARVRFFRQAVASCATA